VLRMPVSVLLSVTTPVRSYGRKTVLPMPDNVLLSVMRPVSPCERQTVRQTRNLTGRFLGTWTRHASFVEPGFGSKNGLGVLFDSQHIVSAVLGEKLRYRVSAPRPPFWLCCVMLGMGNCAKIFGRTMPLLHLHRHEYKTLALNWVGGTHL
jgi:hypothetical protein